MNTPDRLDVVNGRIVLQVCRLYRPHKSAVINVHHICPASWFEAAGLLINTPTIQLCPTCHYDVHAAIDGMIKNQDVSVIPPRCRRLARQAFELASQNHLTPELTL